MGLQRAWSSYRSQKKFPHSQTSAGVAQPCFSPTFCPPQTLFQGRQQGPTSVPKMLVPLLISEYILMGLRILLITKGNTEIKCPYILRALASSLVCNLPCPGVLTISPCSMPCGSFPSLDSPWVVHSA